MSSEPVKTVKMPATLDLVERARMGINGLTGSVDPVRPLMPMRARSTRSRVAGILTVFTGSLLM